MIRTNFIHTTLYAALSLGFVACTGVDKDTVGDSESEGETSESAGSTSAGSTSAGESASSTGGDSGSDTANGGDTSTSGATSGEDPSTTDAPTSTSGSTDSTGGEGDSVSESCEAACEVVLVCLEDQYESMEECVADCIEETMPDEPSAECEAAVIDFNSCVAAASCEDLDSDIFCEAELDLMIELCDFDADDCTGSVGGDALSCGIIQECSGESMMELLCVGDLCRCFVDAEEVGSCTNDVCVDDLDPDVLYEKAFTCCGFEF